MEEFDFPAIDPSGIEVSDEDLDFLGWKDVGLRTPDGKKIWLAKTPVRKADVAYIPGCLDDRSVTKPAVSDGRCGIAHVGSIRMT